MKKLFKIVPILVVLALLLSITAYAEPTAEQETERPLDQIEQQPEQAEPQPKKTVTGIKLVTEPQNRFVLLGQKPDLSAAQLNVTYYDGSEELLPFLDEYLTAFDTTKTGRVGATITAFEKTITEFFIVCDKALQSVTYTDVTSSNWYYKAVNLCSQAGFFVGMGNGSFGASQNMTRAQFCQMMYRVYKDDVSVLTQAAPIQFSDVTQEKWYYEAVTALAASGIINGVGNGLFNPDAQISRQDTAVIMMRILLGADAVEAIDIEASLQNARNTLGIKALDFDKTSEYAKKYICASLGVIYFGDDVGNINPQNNITRAECATMICNYYFKDYTPPQKKRPLVYLSPSNQMTNVYAGFNYTDKANTEGVYMNKVAEQMVPILEAMGYDVHIAELTLPIKGPDVYKRADEAYEMDADVYVAIHSNGSSRTNDTGRYQGTECFYNGNNEGAKELSDAIYKYMSALTPTTDTRGSKDDMLTNNPFSEVKYPKMANVIVEVEFHDYAPYAQWIINNTQQIAQALCQGIDEYLKLKYTAA